MPLYDFRCPQGHRSEQLAAMSVTGVVCRECGDIAERAAVNRIVQRDGDRLEADSATTRQKFRLFREAGEELEATTTQDIPLWEPAKARADAMMAAGEAPATLTERKEAIHA